MKPVVFLLLATVVESVVGGVVFWMFLRRLLRKIGAIEANTEQLLTQHEDLRTSVASLADSHRILTTVALSDLPDTVRGPSVAPWPAD